MPPTIRFRYQSSTIVSRLFATIFDSWSNKPLHLPARRMRSGRLSALLSSKRNSISSSRSGMPGRRNSGDARECNTNPVFGLRFL
jgi:hypothetical protein